MTDGESYDVCSKCGVKLTIPITTKATGHSFINYIFNNDSKIGVDGTETAQCDHCTEKNTRIVPGTAKLVSECKIKDKYKYDGKTIDYKSSLTIYADAERCTDIKWKVSGVNDYTENADCSITINKATNSFTVYYTAKDLNGNTVTSEKETVNVETNFLAKIIAFFKGLFGSLPNLKQ